ncbi:TetR/AcrR family transcriptional regulator [Anaerosporobacter faecicola]|uniref:TetR/AcrR family transcriptional regulator n=1 Tax=Anaerosporobacter faecicola TaxID=2718714 RepID=UPI00143AF582|nr:TetR/AcrR family transcriptional regulator [Anaerosporobacter faecicola]
MARKAEHTSEETKQAIIKAFIELYREERLEKITIQAITKKAGVNRGTFYYYFQDIYELLESLEQQFVERIQRAIQQIINGVLQSDLPMYVEQLLAFYKDNKVLLELFFLQRPNRKVLECAKQYAMSYALSHLGLSPNNLSKEEECIITYMAHAQIGLVLFWLENNQEIQIEQLANIMVRVNQEGPVTTFKSLERKK